MKTKILISNNMATHVERALESFPDEMTKKELIAQCAVYISANPEIYITPGWFAQIMMEDGLLLAKRKNRIKGSKAFTWLNVHKLDGRSRGRLVT